MDYPLPLSRAEVEMGYFGALHAKLDAILRCLTCPECGGSGFVYSRAEFGTSTVPQVGRPDLQIPWVRPPQSSPCPCRVAARRLLDGEAE